MVWGAGKTPSGFDSSAARDPTAVNIIWPSLTAFWRWGVDDI
jgi:hypothetical protein